MGSLFGVTPYEATVAALEAYVLTVSDTQAMAMGAEALRVLEEDGRQITSLLNSEFDGANVIADYAEVEG